MVRAASAADARTALHPRQLKIAAPEVKRPQRWGRCRISKKAGAGAAIRQREIASSPEKCASFPRSEIRRHLPFASKRL
jgi:hypothetical protein